MRENKELLTSTANWQRVFNELLTRHIPGLLVLFLLGGPAAMSQPEVSRSTTESLKEGIVVFVVPTSHQKLSALYEQLKSLEDNRSERRLRALIKSEEMRRDSFATALKEAVEQHFTLTSYIFSADTALRSPPWRDHKSSHFLVMKSQTESGADALLLFDKDGIPLSRPIPYYARIGRFTSFIDAFFGKTSYNWRDLDKVIKRWSEKLEKFYQSR